MRTIISQKNQTFNNVTICCQLLTMLFHSWIQSQVSRLVHYRTSQNKSQLFSVNSFLSSNTNWIPFQLMKTWYHKRHLNPVRVYPEYIVALYFRCQSLEQMQLNSVSSKIYFSNHFFQENQVMWLPLSFQKSTVCPALTAAADVAMWSLPGAEKVGLYTQTFMGFLWDFIN